MAGPPRAAPRRRARRRIRRRSAAGVGRGSVDPSIAARWRANSRTASSRPSGGPVRHARGVARARTARARPRPARPHGAASHSVARAHGRLAQRRVRESRRIAWHSRRSWQRARRTPAASSVGVPARRVAPDPARRRRTLSVAATQSAKSPAAIVAPLPLERRRHRAPRRRPNRPPGRGRSRSPGQSCPPSRSRRKLSRDPSTRSPRHPPACSRAAAPTRT